ncbi:MAG: hypothetical protein ABDH28_02555, partial [Brevinematia bacterium]
MRFGGGLKFLIVAFLMLLLPLGSCYLFFLPGEYEDILSVDRSIGSKGTGGSFMRIYVSTNGDDSNDGITKSTPVRSIQTALSKA